MIPWPQKPPFSTPLSALPGLGKMRLKSLEAKGVATTEDFLSLPPSSYQDRREFGEIASAQDGSELVIEGRITSVKIVPNRYLLANAASQGKNVGLWWFRAIEYFSETIKVGVTVNIYGVVKFHDGRINFHHPEIWTPADDPKSDPNLGIVSVYRPIGSLTAGLRKRIAGDLGKILISCPPLLPSQWLDKHSLKDPVELLAVVHNPPSDAKGTLPKPKGSRAWLRMCLYELMFWRLIITQTRQEIKSRKSKECADYPLNDAEVDRLFEPLPFKPSDEQRRVAIEILKDLNGPAPMNRLLQGEVGCGKTAVAAATIGATLKNGRQAVLMAPTGILASQHRAFFESIACREGYEVFYLTNNQSAKEKNAVLKALAAGTPSLTVGTHSLASPSVAIPNLGLAVIDEQQRFGVKQRLALRLKSPNVNLLTMSATPIPKTFAGILYGDLDISS
ncbi:MAG: DEAD/DEAH box helicase, partial [Deltaproteobacteria bacterium]|nr:DEAD/DEAH box helicase [Deltaproteobacteria bacterium]